MDDDQKVMNRNLVVLGAVLIQLCLGAIYAWSVFTPALKDPEGPFAFSAVQTQAIFSVGLATFAVVMVLAGKLQAKIGPRRVSVMGGVLLGVGYILAGLFGKTFVPQLVFIGLVGGAGIGLAYVCPIKVGMAWFPDKKGLITGLAVAGFGFGALIWVKLAGSWGGLIASVGVLKVFALYGLLFAIAVLVGSVWMVNPPDGWKPEGWEPPSGSDGKPAEGRQMMPREMLRTPQFYGLWGMFIFSAMAGLITIGIIKLFGIDALQQSGYDAATASAVAGTAMAVFYSIANGLGRIAWGSLSDKLGRKACLFLMCLLQGIMMLLFYSLGGSRWGLYCGSAIIGFNFGGNFSLFPTATADFFGPKNVGLNYGWVFTAYGVGGIIGPIMAGYIRDVWKNFQAAFIICGIACLVAAVIGLMLKAPSEAEPEGVAEAA